MKSHRKILIAATGAADDLVVLNKGLEICRDEKCQAIVLKVVPRYEGELDLTGITYLRDVLTSNEVEKLDSINRAVRQSAVSVDVRVEEGAIAETINSVAEEEGCDLVVLGRKKREGLLSSILGDSVSEKVARSAPCPVLIVDT